MSKNINDSQINLPIEEVCKDISVLSISKRIDGDKKFRQYYLESGVILDKIVCMHIDAFIKKKDDTSHRFFYDNIDHIISWKNGIMELTRYPINGYIVISPIVTKKTPYEYPYQPHFIRRK